MTRRYCWRVGGAWEQEDGSDCDECGVPFGSHPETAPATCGNFVASKGGDGGFPCRLHAAHTGGCLSKEHFEQSCMEVCDE